MGFYKNVLTVLRGATLSQLILLITMPILTRLYSPDEFGAFHALASVVAVLVVGSALRMEVGILSETLEMLGDLISTCLLLSVVTSACVLTVLVLWNLIGEPTALPMGSLVYAVPFCMLGAGVASILSYFVLRTKNFHRGASARIVQSSAFSVLALGIGSIFPSSLSLVLSDLFGKLAYSLTCLYGSLIGGGVKLRLPDLGVLSRTISRHRQLVRLSLPGAFISVLVASYTPVVLLVLFSANEAGQYAITERLVGGPLGMIAAAVSQVFMAHFADAGSSIKGSQRDVFRRLVWNQARIIAIPAVVFFYSAEAIFPVVLGSDWVLAGAFAQPMTLIFLTAFIVGPVNMALTIAGHQKLQLSWDISRFVVVSGVWFISYHMRLSPIESLWLVCGASALCQGAYVWMADWALGSLSTSGKR